MSFDIRLLGSFEAAETLEELSSSQRRWILCSRDYCRGASVVAAITDRADGLGIMPAFPAESAIDGNRQSSLRTVVGINWIRLTLNLGSSDRKALLYLEYFEGREVEPLDVEFSNDANGPWVSVFSGVTALYRGERFSLWKLPFDSLSGDDEVKTCSLLGSELTANPAGGGETGYWDGGYAIPQSGENSGLARRIAHWTAETGKATLESVWPYALPDGSAVLFRKYLGGQVNGTQVRIKLANRWDAGLGSLRLVGMSLFDYYLELKGDAGQFQRFRAPNPTSVNRKIADPIDHNLLDGSVRTEWRHGPKRFLTIQWPCAYAGFFDWLEDWMSAGMGGIVDEDGRYLQGILRGAEGDKLDRAENRGEEGSFKATFREV